MLQRAGVPTVVKDTDLQGPTEVRIEASSFHTVDAGI